jgi:hypothetical protein
MMKIEGDDVVLSSGKRVHANGAIIGLRLSEKDANSSQVYGGYDQDIHWPFPEWWSEEEKAQADYYLTEVEMKGLATYMAERWKALAERL